MKAAIYLGKENVEVKEIKKPVVKENDVLIQNIYSSICGTDVAVFFHGPNTGHRICVNQEFGHETISRVVQVGKNVKDFKIGQRVYPYPYYAKKDTSRAGTLGGFSEYILIENAKLNHNLYFVDKAIQDRLACLIEPFTVGTRAARQGMDKTGQNAVVFGCGTIGVAAASAFRYFGMSKIMIVDYSNYRLNIAKKLGFKTCNAKDENLHACMEAYFGYAKALNGQVANIDCWLDAAGASSILDDFQKYGKIFSRFVSVAVNNERRNIDLLHMTYAQQRIIGSGGYMPEDVHDVQKIMVQHPELEIIITDEYKLDQIKEALYKAGNVDTALNIVIEM